MGREGSGAIDPVGWGACKNEAVAEIEMGSYQSYLLQKQAQNVKIFLDLVAHWAEAVKKLPMLL
ncbi:MAG: hypothetical protein R3E52_15410 [Burkholderiaceae bacterium]